MDKSEYLEFRVRELVQIVVYLSLINKKLGTLSIPKISKDKTIEKYVQKIMKEIKKRHE